MTDERPRVTVLGAGSWGTGVAHHLQRSGNAVTLWGRDAEVLAQIAATHENAAYLPGIKLDAGLAVSADLASAEGSELIVFCVPSQAMRQVARDLARALKVKTAGTLIVTAAKGLEEGSRKFMTGVLREELGDPSRIAALSGPTFSREVAMGLPTAVTVAAEELETAKRAAAYFHSECFRVYASDDLTGVEISGVVKNVVALAAGVVDGMGLGANARAALITRGLAEMKRLVLALEGRSETLTGLSGLGDLVLTATGDLSRNRRVGLGLGRGRTLTEVLDEIGQVAEGVTATHLVHELAAEHGISMPITAEMAQVLRGESTVAESMRRLLSRAPAIEGV